MSGFLHFGNNKPGRVVFNRREDIEPHEIFYDLLAKKHEEKLDIAEKRFEISLPRNVLVFPFALACVFFLVVVARVFQLQLVDGKEFLAQAAQNKYLFHKVQSDRGIIYDKDFKPLVENTSTFDLECAKAKMPAADAERKKVVTAIAAVANGNADELENAIKNGKNPVIENLEHRALIFLEARIDDFPGCYITRRPIRNYAQNYGLAHLLGYMGKIEPDEWKAFPENYSISDYVGRAGLEKTYENILRKNPGKLRIERDARGSIISQNVAVSPESGDSIQLWLDLGLQKKLEESMRQQLAALGLKRGSAVALNPKTGGVLAMVSFPDYDNNVFSTANSQAITELFNDKNNPLFNRVISGRYLTGSTIKPLEAAAAQQEKLINPNKSIDCQGKLVIPNQYNPELSQTINDNHTHGLTDMRKALAESCNVYFWTIGGGWEKQNGLGPTRIKKYLELFGWGSPTGIDLPGETGGFIPDPAWKKQRFAGTQDQSWTDGDTYNLAIGQGFIGITPLEVANSYAAIANGGILYRPQMVARVVDSAKNTVEEKQPEVIRKDFIEPENLRVIREGMRHAVNGANAPLASSLVLNSLPVEVAAKTGTAQLRKGSDGKDIMNSWVGAFAPYNDPEIVIVVMMEDVHEGQLAVLPVAKDVLGWYFGPKEPEGSEAAADDSPEATSTDGAVLEEDPAGAGDAIVPGNATDLIPLLNLDGGLELLKPEDQPITPNP